MVEVVPGFAGIPLSARAKVRVLDAASRCLNVLPGLSRRVFAAAPRPLARLLREVAAPVRIFDRRSATIPATECEKLRSLPRASADPAAPIAIVMATFGNVERLALALLSIAAYSAPRRFSLCLVDDGAPNAAQVAETLRLLPGARGVRNETNRGFSHALNRGVAECQGDVLVLMNDDVVVTPGWLDTLVSALEREPRAGLVGPVSNDTGDVATVAANYQSLDGLLAAAAGRGAGVREVEKLALFCAVIRREELAALGGLDEGYGRGMFEDDDLCQALRARGRRVLLADGAYVHHEAGSSFRRLSSFEYLARFEVNRRRFERKWNTRWRPSPLGRVE